MVSDEENERSRKEEGDRKGKGKAKDQDQDEDQGQDGDDQPQQQQQMKEIRRPPPLPAVKGTMGAIGTSINIHCHSLLASQVAWSRGSEVLICRIAF
jgi:hypothetical protein